MHQSNWKWKQTSQPYPQQFAQGHEHHAKVTRRAPPPFIDQSPHVESVKYCREYPLCKTSHH